MPSSPRQLTPLSPQGGEGTFRLTSLLPFHICHTLTHLNQLSPASYYNPDMPGMTRYPWQLSIMPLRRSRPYLVDPRSHAHGLLSRVQSPLTHHDISN